MSRFVLRYRGPSPRHAESGVDTAAVVVRAGAKVLDDAPNMLLVEASARAARNIEHLLPEWELNAEVVTPMPGVARPAVRAARRR